MSLPDPRIDTYIIVMVPYLHSMVGDASQLSGNIIIISIERSSIAIASQIFGREEGGSTNMTYCTCFLF